MTGQILLSWKWPIAWLLCTLKSGFSYHAATSCALYARGNLEEGFGTGDAVFHFTVAVMDFWKLFAGKCFSCLNFLSWFWWCSFHCCCSTVAQAVYTPSTVTRELVVEALDLSWGDAISPRWPSQLNGRCTLSGQLVSSVRQLQDIFTSP